MYTRNLYADAHVIVAGAHAVRADAAGVPRYHRRGAASRFFQLGIVRIDRGSVLVWDSKEGSE